MIREAEDPNGADRRAAAGLAAGLEVQSSALTLERDATKLYLARLERLKREIQGTLAAAADAGGFKSFTSASLITQIDHLVADATAELADGKLRSRFNQAADLGTAKIDHALAGARVAVGTTPNLDRAIVTHAFDTNAELLTAAMQQFRNQVVQGVRRAAVAGDASFDQLRALAGSIDRNGFDGAKFKAERIMRTELGRVLSGASYDRLVALAADLPFLRKGWRSAKDGRTRQGHLEAGKLYARGHGILVREPFRINVYEEFPGKPVGKLLGVASLRFPIDPLATPKGRIAAGATILCRCNLFADFDLADLAQFSTGKSRAVAVPQPIAGFAEPPIAPPNRPTPEPPIVRLTAAEARQQLNRILAEGELKHELLAKEFNRLADLTYDTKARMEKLVDEVLNADPALVALRAEYVKAKAAYDAAGEQLRANREAMIAKGREAVRLDPRLRGTIDYAFAPDTEFHQGTSTRYNKKGQALPTVYVNQAEAKARITDAIAIVEQLVSKDLSFGKVVVDNARDRLTGKIPLSPRAYAVAAADVANMGADATRPGRRPNSVNYSPWETPRTVAHELGHLLEFNNPNVREAALAFLERRTRGEAAHPLNTLVPGSGYESYEVARKDKFIDAYIGKDYGAAARVTEVISMGLEYMFDNPTRLAREDPDMFDFIYDLLRGHVDPKERKP